MGGDLGRAAYGIARADGAPGQPLGCDPRQPIGQIGGKGGGRDNQVGYDAGKQVKGRKIHVLVDSEGLPMRVVVHSAAIQDRDGAGLVLDKIRRRFPWLELIWADGGYNAWQVEAAVAKVPVLRMEIVKRSDDMKGFVVLPRRWVVERTFSWFGRNRRLAKDFENLAETLASFVILASIQLAIRRLARV
jgi:transposase